MSGFLESLLTVCAVLIAVGLLQRFCPESAMIQFAAGLVALSVILSTVMTLPSVQWDLSFSGVQTDRQTEELTSYVEGLYEEAAQQDFHDYVEGLLAVAGLQAKEIRVLTDRTADGSIVLTEVEASFSYSTEEERARALLQNALGEDVRVTVESGG